MREVWIKKLSRRISAGNTLIRMPMVHNGFYESLHLNKGRRKKVGLSCWCAADARWYPPSRFCGYWHVMVSTGERYSSQHSPPHGMYQSVLGLASCMNSHRPTSGWHWESLSGWKSSQIDGGAEAIRSSPAKYHRVPTMFRWIDVDWGALNLQRRSAEQSLRSATIWIYWPICKTQIFSRKFTRSRYLVWRWEITSLQLRIKKLTV